MLRDSALGHAAALGEFAYGDLVGLDDALKDSPASGVCKGAHDGVDCVGFIHANTLAIAN